MQRTGPLRPWLLLPLAVLTWAVAAFALDTLPYYPFHTGDGRALRAQDVLVREKVTGTRDIGGLVAWKTEMYASDDPETLVAYWAQDSAGSKLVAFEYSGQIIQLQPPILFPSRLEEGQRVQEAGQLVHPLFGAIGTYDGYMIVESVSAQAETPAGLFANCLQIFYRFDLQVIGQGAQQITSRERRAVGVGPVWIQDGSDPDAQPYVLAYARVGGHYYGQPADVTGDGTVDGNDAVAMLEARLVGHTQYSVFCDLAPFDGQLPSILPIPDGAIDDNDLATFIELFRTARR